MDRDMNGVASLFRGRWRIAYVPMVALLTLAIFVGGSSQYGMMSTAVLELASLPVLGAGIWLWVKRGFGGALWPVAILLVGVAAAAAQLAPLPLRLWRTLPGRDALLGGILAAGAHPSFLTASLNPDATARALLSLLPGAAAFFGVLVLDGRERVRLTQCLLAVGAVSVVVGLAQATGQAPAFYSVANTGSAVGFFANRNHFAGLMYALMPFVASLVVQPGVPRQRWRRSSMIWAALAVLLLLGVAASGSRAGIVLAVAASIGAAAVVTARYLRPGRGRGWAMTAAVIGAVAIVGVLQFSRVGAFDQKGGPFDEGRFAVTATTLGAAAAYVPIGSGLGTFATVYTAAEPSAFLSPEYVNHAHDDWAELWLEGSVPIAAVLAAFLGWYAFMGFRAWTADNASIAQDVDLARAAFIAVGLLLIHSTVDYPLRTGALMAVFGFACALLVPPPSGDVTEAGRDPGARSRRARRRDRQVDFIRPDTA